MIMRPDEIANESEIDRDRRFRRNVGTGIATAASLGSSALGAGIAAKVIPFLSKYVPPDLAMKGISKISPKLGDFLKRGQSAGLNIEEGLQYVKEQLTPKQEAAKENRNIIEQYSPELHQFILKEVQGGRSPLEAGALATLSGKGDKSFKKIIDKITKDHKAPWSAILQTVYGGQGEQQQKQQQGAPPPQSGQQQPGSGIDPQLAQLMNGIRSSIGKLRGSP